MTYFDTSALIKRFVEEKGSALVRSLATRDGPVITAKIAYAEVYSGLARKRREGGVSHRDYVTVCGEFERDWQAYVRVDLRDEVLVTARDLIERHPLRGFDAIHLASALTVWKVLGEEIAFAAADERLLRAAAAEGLRPVSVERRG